MQIKNKAYKKNTLVNTFFLVEENAAYAGKVGAKDVIKRVKKAYPKLLETTKNLLKLI